MSCLLAQLGLFSRSLLILMGFFGVFCTSGDVITMECYEKLIKKDMIHPLTNDKLKEKDIIVMQRVSSEVVDRCNQF